MRIPMSVLRRILSHAVAEYPMECCGLLVGRGDEVRAAAAVRNLCAGERYDRFELDPVGHVQVWEAARATGDEIVGCYHSHPDGQARPSTIDRRLARRFGGPFGYVVVAIGDEESSGVYAGMIREDGEIVRVPLDLSGSEEAGNGRDGP